MKEKLLERRASMRATGNHCAYFLLTLAALFFCMSITAAKGQTRSDKHLRETSSPKIQQLLSDEGAEEPEVIHDVFKFGDKAVPTLVTALRNRKNVERAVWALVYLGSAKERKLLLDAIRGEKDKGMKLFMSSFLAGALVEPASEEEWKFLATCIRSYRDEDEGAASLSAALALGENGSQRALHILEAIEPAGHPQDSDSDMTDIIDEIHQASRWITQKSASNPSISAERGSASEQIKQTVLDNAFYAEGERPDLSVEEVIFTGDKRRALASVEVYHGPKNARGYDIVLEHRSGKWKIIGIWVTWLA